MRIVGCAPLRLTQLHRAQLHRAQLCRHVATVILQVRLASMAENSFNAVERVDEFSHVESEGGPADDSPPPAGYSRGPSRVASASTLSDLHRRNGSAANGADGESSALDGTHSAGYGGGDASGEDDSAEPIELPPGFPRYGEIRFEDAQMRYRPNLPLVLKGLTLTIEPGSTVRCSMLSVRIIFRVQRGRGFPCGTLHVTFFTVTFRASEHRRLHRCAVCGLRCLGVEYAGTALKEAKYSKTMAMHAWWASWL